MIQSHMEKRFRQPFGIPTINKVNMLRTTALKQKTQMLMLGWFWIHFACWDCNRLMPISFRKSTLNSVKFCINVLLALRTVTQQQLNRYDVFSQNSWIYNWNFKRKQQNIRWWRTSVRASLPDRSPKLCIYMSTAIFLSQIRAISIFSWQLFCAFSCWASHEPFLNHFHCTFCYLVELDLITTPIKPWHACLPRLTASSI